MKDRRWWRRPRRPHHERDKPESPVRAGTHPSGGAGGSGVSDFAPCGGAKAGGIGGGCAGTEKSKYWCGRGVTKEDEDFASQAQRLVIK